MGLSTSVWCRKRKMFAVVAAKADRWDLISKYSKADMSQGKSLSFMRIYSTIQQEMLAL